MQIEGPDVAGIGQLPGTIGASVDLVDPRHGSTEPGNATFTGRGGHPEP